MSSFFFFFSIFLLSLPFFLLSAQQNQNDEDNNSKTTKGYLVNCGSLTELKVGSLKYAADVGFTSIGNTTKLDIKDLSPLLSSLRYFPDTFPRKYCYVFHVRKGAKYLVRTTYFYGGFDKRKDPPVFDQIIQGTKWSLVNTTDDFANGLSSYYEIIVSAAGKELSVCLARNSQTTSHPFISALEVEYLDDSLYNSTDFNKYALSTVARSSFAEEQEIIGYPNDPYNRIWEPYKDLNPFVRSQSNITPGDFWNKPPPQIFTTGITTTQGKTLTLRWPPMSLASGRYYIALYFQDNRAPGSSSWRVFSVSVNGGTFFKDVNVTANGVMVYATEWPISGDTEFTLTPAEDSSVGPVINAGEVFQILPLGGRTHTKDVKVMQQLAKKIKNTPIDWRGDPCLPTNNSWTGVACSNQTLARVVTLNLTNFGLSGRLPKSIDNLTSLQHLWLGGNQLSGSIPEMESLEDLETLHLENNKFEGRIPESLSKLENLREIFFQNNNLDEKIPPGLKTKSGVNFQ